MTKKGPVEESKDFLATFADNSEYGGLPADAPIKKIEVSFHGTKNSPLIMF